MCESISSRLIGFDEQACFRGDLVKRVAGYSILVSALAVVQACFSVKKNQIRSKVQVS